MKSLTLVITILTLCACSYGQPILQDNTTKLTFGDSFLIDGDSIEPQTGGMFGHYDIANDFSMNPSFTNIMDAQFPRSGGTMNDQCTAAAAVLPIFTFNYVNGVTGTNIGLAQSTSNGNQFSNAFFLVVSNNIQFPMVMTNGTAMTNEGGIAVLNPVAWYTFSEPAGNNAHGGYLGSLQDDYARMYASSNAITQGGGITNYDLVNTTSNAWVTDFNLSAGANFNIITAPNEPSKVGHLRPEGEWYWWMRKVIRQAAGDTNIVSATIFCSGATPLTNHCSATSVSINGNVISYIRVDNRRPGAWDMKGLAGDGLVYTNDCSKAYTLIDTDSANWLFYGTIIPDAPVGFYDIRINNKLCASGISYLDVRKGWNEWTNTTGDVWSNRFEVLGRVRDAQYMNRTNRVLGPSGDGIGWNGFGSLVGGLWPTFHGDTLIKNQSVTNYIWHMRTNSIASWGAIHSAAASIFPVTYSFSNTTQVISVPVAPFALISHPRMMNLSWNPGGYSNFVVKCSYDSSKKLNYWPNYLNETITSNNLNIPETEQKMFFAVIGVDYDNDWFDFATK